MLTKKEAEHYDNLLSLLRELKEAKNKDRNNIDLSKEDFIICIAHLSLELGAFIAMREERLFSKKKE